MNFQILVGLILTVGLATATSHAAKLKSFCTVPENSGAVTGINIDERLPIASVSKVFTSLFAISQMPVSRKVYTQFYYTDVGGGLYDVHIQGGNEPYFNRESMQLLISKLNEVGVTKINQLTFDENFKYLHATDQAFRINSVVIDPVTNKKKAQRLFYDPVSGKNQLAGPLPAVVKFELEALAKFKDPKAGKSKEKQIVFKPKTIIAVQSDNFKIPSQAKKAFIASPDLLHMIKMMNWKSNNHAADKMLILGGGLEKFNQFFHGTMKFSENDLRFINGSGQNAELNGRLYNEATCISVLRALKGLKKNLEKQNSKFEDALAVIGGDIGSTFSGKYITPATRLSVIAKTGTVGTNVTLAGMISAKTGNHFFLYNVETSAATGRQGKGRKSGDAEMARSRAIIAQHLNTLIATNEFGGPNPIKYDLKVFDKKRFAEDGDEENIVETIDVETTKLVAADVPMLAINKSAPPIGLAVQKLKTKGKTKQAVASKPKLKRKTSAS